jgi:dihydropteroate synthase
MEIGGRTFAWGTRTFVMGIINVSPESFSGDGIADTNAAVRQGLAFVEQGADILDVGGQSTRPVYSATVEASLRGTGSGVQYEELDPEEELRRVVGVIKGLTAATDVPVSVDTYKPSVAQEALNAGAAMINDIWGLKRDASLALVAAKAEVPLVLMHNQEGTSYGDLIPDIVASLQTSMDEARRGGVGENKIIVDPGFGFGKTVAGNLEVIRRLSELRELGRPILLGSSRKSTIGRILDEPADRRVEGTAATVAIGIQNGADIVRVHDVEQMAKVVRMADAVVRGLTGEG